MRRILVLAWAEVLHVVRDRATLVQVLVIPALQLVVLANAATFQVRNTPAWVVDQDRSSASRGLISRLGASGHFRIATVSGSTAAGDEALRRGDATLLMVIPPRFEEDLVRGGSAPVQLTINAEKGTAAGIVQFYAARILDAYAIELGVARTGAPQREAPRPGGRVEVRVRNWYNPSRAYTHYMVPGLLVSLVTMIGTLLTAQNIAREKELGTLEQLNVTPITRGQFIAAKLLPFWVLAMIDLTVGLIVGRYLFGMPIRGSLLLLFGAAGIYLVVALGFGLFISTLVETQQQAMFVTFFVMMVYLLMSGLFTPIESMPHWVQVVAEANPVRHFVAVSRAILLKGAGPAEIARPMAILSGFAVGVLWLAVHQYSKRTA